MAEVPRPVPCRLNEGIAFEDTGLILRWGTPITEIAKFESPEILQRPNSILLTWRGRVCLGGLPCDVGAFRINEPPNPRAYRIYLAEFHWAHLEGRVEWGKSDAEVERGFREVFGHLEWLLGPATFSYPEYDRGLPAVFWELPQLLVGYHLSSSGDRPSISVAHEPEGYTALKAEAKSLDHRGARVDFVAWPGWRSGLGEGDGAEGT